ncbi:MAG: serine/threonine protein kinase [Luteimonas sp.]|nr:serine/threonine protein kinase [Luteimonas sp.]
MNRLPMDPDRWQRVCDLFEDAIELRGQARTDFIALHCKDDPVVHEALEAMLAGDARTALLDAALVDLVDTTALTPADAPDCSGERLGHFVLGNALGRGGMGVVYAAHREDDFRQQVAIKRLHQRWEGSLQAERFVQERQILAALSHPNIARLLDGGIDAHGQPWFAMERIEGAPITAWADDQHLSLSARIDLFRQVCRAVQHAHERFVVHRDLKPDNILVDGSGNAKVLDFGVAKLVDPLAENTTRTGMAVGFTPEYAAPEQISSGNITAATDVYSLGLILYQLLTGRLPYDLDAHDLPARMHAISQGTPMRLEQALISGDSEQVLQRLRWRNTDLGSYRRFVRGDLTRILQTALAKEPERRYATAQAMDDDLQRLLRGRPVSVSGDTFTYRARKFVSRNRWGVAMASLAVLALIGGSLGILLQSSRVQAEAARATREAEQQQAVTDFMLQVFSSASVNTGGDPDISLADAMKLAVDTALETHENNPQVTLGVLAAAATGYDELAQREQAVALIRQGLDIQQRHAPHALAERGRLLTLLSQLDIEAPLEQVLARAEEGLQAQYAAGSPRVPSSTR